VLGPLAENSDPAQKEMLFLNSVYNSRHSLKRLGLLDVGHFGEKKGVKGTLLEKGEHSYCQWYLSQRPFSKFLYCESTPDQGGGGGCLAKEGSHGKWTGTLTDQKKIVENRWVAGSKVRAHRPYKECN